MFQELLEGFDAYDVPKFVKKGPEEKKTNPTS